jgi:hypothetical protein
MSPRQRRGRCTVSRLADELHARRGLADGTGRDTATANGVCERIGGELPGFVAGSAHRWRSPRSRLRRAALCAAASPDESFDDLCPIGGVGSAAAEMVHAHRRRRHARIVSPAHVDSSSASVAETARSAHPRGPTRRGRGVDAAIGEELEVLFQTRAIVPVAHVAQNNDAPRQVGPPSSETRALRV